MAEMAGGPGSADETLLIPPDSGVLAIQLGSLFKTKLFQEILEENRADLDEVRDKIGLDLRQIERVHVVLLAEEFLKQGSLYLKEPENFASGSDEIPPQTGPPERQIRTGPPLDRRPAQGPAVTGPAASVVGGIPDFLVIVLTFNKPQDWAQSTPRGMRKIAPVANAPGSTFDIGDGGKLHLCPGEKTVLIGGVTGLEKFMYMGAGGPEKEPVAKFKKMLVSPENHLIFQGSSELVAKALPGYFARLQPPFHDLKNFLGTMQDLSVVGRGGDNLVFVFEARYPGLPATVNAFQEAKDFVGVVANPRQRAMLGALAFATKGKEGAVLALYADILAQLQPSQQDLTIVQTFTLSGIKLKRALAGAFKPQFQPSRQPNNPRSQPMVTSD